MTRASRPRPARLLKWARSSPLWALALATAGGGCGSPFTAAGGDGGTMDSPGDRSGDGNADANADGFAPDSPTVDGPGADAGCAAPAGAAGGTCLPDLVALAGWRYTSFQPGGTSCPAGYDTSSAVFTPGGPATCMCDCSGGTVSCGGSVALYYSSATGVTGCPATPTTSSSASCIPVLIPITGSVKAVAPVPMFTSCSSSVSKTKPPDVSGLMCNAQVGRGGCHTGEVCVPTASSAKVCIKHNGDVTCPKGAFTRYVVASSFDDTRACGTCKCDTVGVVGCSIPELKLFVDTTCTTPSSTSSSVPANGMCETTGNTKTIQSVSYSATPSTGGCIGTPPAPTGGESPNDARTLCCAP